MERLSEIATEILNELHTERLDYTGEYIPLIDAINKLAEYEDLEEQGLLLRLPCKVGDTVWYMAREILQCKVRAVVSSFYDEAEIHLKYNGENDLLEHWNVYVGMDEIGKKVFLTKEEAEQALKQLQGD